MKTFMTVVMAMAATMASLAEEGKLALKGSWETAVDSIYLGPEGMVLHDKPIIENSLTLSGEVGWYAGIWTAFPLEKAQAALPEESVPEAPAEFPNQALADIYTIVDAGRKISLILDPPPLPAAPFEGEVDIFAGLEKEFGKLKLNGKLMYWLVGNLGDPADDLWSVNLKVSVPNCPIFQPFVEVEHVGEVGNLSPKSGNFVFAGLTRRQPLGFKIGKAEAEQALDLELRGAWSDGAFGFEPAYVYTRLTVSTDIQLTKSCHLVPQLLYQLAGSDQTGAADDYVDGNKLAARLAFRLDF